jgi:SHS2 domain-containing protein
MAAPRFRRLAHAADVRLAVWGDSEEELLRNAVTGALTCALERPLHGGSGRRRSLVLGARDAAGRVVSVVNEALFLLYARREIVVDVRLAGDRADLAVAPLPPAWRPVTEVKAATFHDIRVSKYPRRRVVLTLDL